MITCFFPYLIGTLGIHTVNHSAQVEGNIWSVRLKKKLNFFNPYNKTSRECQSWYFVNVLSLLSDVPYG